MIYILNGPVRTGKTTALLNWVSDKQHIDGVLCPDDINGKRYFLQLRSQQRFKLEAGDSTEERDAISVGRFRFLKSAFTEANRYLISVAEKKNYTWLIIDELGKLELKDTGLHDAAKSVIKQHEFNVTLHIIIVVRNTLLHEILAHYSITEFQLVNKEELTGLI